MIAITGSSSAQMSQLTSIVVSRKQCELLLRIFRHGRLTHTPTQILRLRYHDRLAPPVTRSNPSFRLRRSISCCGVDGSRKCPGSNRSRLAHSRSLGASASSCVGGNVGNRLDLACPALHPDGISRASKHASGGYTPSPSDVPRVVQSPQIHTEVRRGSQAGFILCYRDCTPARSNFCQLDPAPHALPAVQRAELVSMPVRRAMLVRTQPETEP
jgi:hypothetical protein